MRTIALIAAFALATQAWAQAEKPAAAKESAKPAPAQEAAKTEAPKPAAKKSNPRRQEDARHCLEKESNTEIIKCAEAYL